MSVKDTVATQQPASTQVDPRGLRVAAGITAVVVALVLVLPSPAREIVLALQVAVFATAAIPIPSSTF